MHVSPQTPFCWHGSLLQCKGQLRGCQTHGLQLSCCAADAHAVAIVSQASHCNSIDCNLRLGMSSRSLHSHVCVALMLYLVVCTCWMPNAAGRDIITCLRHVQSLVHCLGNLSPNLKQELQAMQACSLPSVLRQMHGLRSHTVKHESRNSNATSMLDAPSDSLC